MRLRFLDMEGLRYERKNGVDRQYKQVRSARKRQTQGERQGNCRHTTITGRTPTPKREPAEDTATSAVALVAKQLQPL